MAKTLKEQLKEELHEVIKGVNKSLHNHSLKIHEQNTSNGINYISVDKEVVQTIDNKEFKTHHPLAQISLEQSKFILYNEGYKVREEDSYEAIYAPIHRFVRDFAATNGLTEPEGENFRKPFEEFLDEFKSLD